MRSSLVAAGASAPAAAPRLLLPRARHAVSAAPLRPAGASAAAAVAVKKRPRFAVAAAAVSSRTSSSSSTPSSASSSSSPSTPSPSSSSSSSSFDSSSSTSPAPPPRFKIHTIAGDGSCLFRALAQGAHYLNASSSSSDPRSSSPSPPSKDKAAATTSTSAFSLGAPAPSPLAAPPPLLLAGPDLLAAGFAARRRICAALVRNKDSIEPFLETPFHAYIDAMSAEGTWGGEPELSVAPEALGRPVCVYSRARDDSGSAKSDFASLFFGDDIVKVSEYGVDDFEGVAPICLLFGGLHYDLLIVES